MARVTVEDCLEKVANRFELVMIASKRARQLALTATDPLVPHENDKPTVLALREIAEGLVSEQSLREEEARNQAREEQEAMGHVEHLSAESAQDNADLAAALSKEAAASSEASAAIDSEEEALATALRGELSPPAPSSEPNEHDDLAAALQQELANSTPSQSDDALASALQSELATAAENHQSTEHSASEEDALAAALRAEFAASTSPASDSNEPSAEQDDEQTPPQE